MKLIRLDDGNYELNGTLWNAEVVEHFDSALALAKREKLDAGETNFLLRQLTYLYAQIKEVKYNALKARAMFPVASGLGRGLENINHEVVDYSGKAKIIGSKSSDYPVANSSSNEITHPVRELGICIQLFEMDLLKAARSGKPLNTRMLTAAIRGMEQTIDDIAFNGDSDYKLKGLFSDISDMTSVTIDATGTGSGDDRKDWKRKTSALIEKDIQDMLTAVPDYFQGMKYVLGLSPANMAILKTKRIGTDTNMNLYNYILENLDIEEIVPSTKFKTVANLSSKGTTVLYPRDPEVLELSLPQDRLQKAPFQDGRIQVIDVVAEISGLHKYHPKAIVIADRIGNGSDT
jgi:hypothetical protein